MGQPAGPGIRATTRRPAAWALALALTGAVVVAGCGSEDKPAEAQPSARLSWTVVLDYQPNAVHAGLLHADQAGYFDRAGLNLEIVAPSSTSDSLTQVNRGRADVGLADLIDVARRNDRAQADAAKSTSTDASATSSTPAAPRPAMTLVGAIVQRPMSGILVDASSAIKTPQELRGKKIAVTGLPSDEAVVDAMVNAPSASGASAAVTPELVTLGFNGLKALDSGRVDGATAYWPADSVTLTDLGTKPRVFALDEFGGPRYPGLVAFTSRRLAARQPQLLKAFGDALARGTREVAAKPELGRKAVAEAYPELDPKQTARQLDALVPLFGEGDSAGRVDRAALVAFSKFAADAKLTSRALSPAELGLRDTP